MGLCASGPASADPAKLKAQQQRNRELDRQLRMDQSADAQVHKLLFLGAGESGKSTLLKQMKDLHGKGMNDEERAEYRDIIIQNVWKNLAKLLEMSTELAGEDFKIDGTEIAPDLHQSRDWLLGEIKENAIITTDHVPHITELWNDPGVQKTYANRSKFQLDDSTPYWMNKENLNRIAQPNYLPTKPDVLRSRTRTTGIVEEAIESESNNFVFFDVGGQRNERKKWIHCFENVTAVMFVAALSGYDLVLFEDETQNRMDEALDLFRDTVNNKWFSQIPIILFLNKRDLFTEKIRTVPLTVWRDDIDFNPHDEVECKEYIESCFMTCNNNKSRNVYPHFTNATDPNNVKHVFESVRDMVIRDSLAEGGLF